MQGSESLSLVSKGMMSSVCNATFFFFLKGEKQVVNVSEVQLLKTASLSVSVLLATVFPNFSFNV